MKRINTKKIMVGNVQIGNQNKVIIQSMCNTKTKDINATIDQILSLEKVGCEIVRVACLDIEDAYAIKEIKRRIHIPIVADIHFNYKIALAAIEAGADKIRINPGNINNLDYITQIVKACQGKNIPIRIGVNSGSLEKDILEKYNNIPCAEAMIESIDKSIHLLESLNFYNIIISLKSTDLNCCIKAYELASKKFSYPLHIGITESGTEFSGTIKSCVGLGYILRENIGDTIRVSITTDPVKEIIIAKEILKNCGLYNNLPTIISCPTCGRTQIDLINIVKKIEPFINQLKVPITVAIMGCAVNGPGEAKFADIGLAGGKSKCVIFRKGEIIKTVDQKIAVETLKKEILELINDFNNK